MTTAKELRRRIEECELQHDAFREHLAYLSGRIEDAREGFAATVEWVVGPSRVGKSALIKALMRANPEVKVHGRREVPVLHVPIPSDISPKLLPEKVLTALGLPLSSAKSAGEKSKRMADQLRLAHTRAILFEEASHLVEPGAKVLPRATGDWFKSFSEENLNVTIVLFGVPRLQRLIESNEQLKERASARREFWPYDFRQEKERAAFASCVRAYADLFHDHGWPIEISLSTLVLQCYLLCGGLVGRLSRFMRELARLVASQTPRPLTWEDCAIATAFMEVPGHPDFPAFSNHEVSQVALQAAHGYVLELNDMPVRRLRTVSGGAR